MSTTHQQSAGAPRPDVARNSIGLGMAAPTILAFGTPQMQERYLRPLFACEEIWCQLFSEPGAGSDLAGVATRAVPDGDDWVVDGQKVWTSAAQKAQKSGALGFVMIFVIVSMLLVSNLRPPASAGARAGTAA